MYRSKMIMVALMMVAWAATGAVAQEPEPSGETIRIDVKMVEVEFAVVDANNRLLTSLRPEDLRVYESGRPQKLEVFRGSDQIPMVLSLLIDKSASQEAVLTAEKNAIDLFFDSIRPGRDYCSLSTFQWKLAHSSGLTDNIRRLKSALRGVDRDQIFRDEEGGVPLLGTALYDAIATTVREILTGVTARRLTGEGGREGDDLTQRRAIRRAMIVLTDGLDTASQTSLDEAISLCQRHGIAVYAIGVGDRARRREVNREVLERLATETGGIALYPESERELDTQFKKMVEALSSLYLVAYYPTEEATRGFRKIEIKLPHHPAARVIHRTGYKVETEK
jgi:VWFA-related protein